MIEAMILLLGFFIGGTVAQKQMKEPEVRTEVKYVDIETYKTWGTTRMVPIGVRRLPSEHDMKSNPRSPW